MRIIKEVGPIMISIAAIVISFFSLYTGHLRPPKVEIIAGEHMNINYFIEGNLGLTIPVSFTNKGATIETVRRIALLIQLPGSSEGYLLEPMGYQKLTEKAMFVAASMPEPIVIPPRDTVTKQILFRSSIERPSEFRLNKGGTYSLTLLGWTKGSFEPNAVCTFSIQISDKEIKTLQDWHQEGSTNTILLRQSEWRRWSAHHLTDLEVKALKSK